MSASNLRFGPGSTKEVGNALEQLKCRRVVVFTDQNLRQNLPGVKVLQESLEASAIEYAIFDQVSVEPTNDSFQEAIAWLRSYGDFDAIVAIGGGSVIDTAKAANLYACHPPSDFYDYVNPQVGKGMPVPGPLKPLIGVPTTAGTGSETTGVAIFDDTEHRAKTGVAHRTLRPTLGILDPVHLETVPTKVATYTGLDVLCHALESYTALPFRDRPAPTSPHLRPAYQGSNPISDVWALFALETCAHHLPKVVQGNTESRAAMALASSSAGMGFGNAGVHLCHGMSYPVASQVKEYQGYSHVSKPLVPHGLSVIANAPAVFAFTGQACPDRHARGARILADARQSWDSTAALDTEDAGEWLADEIQRLCSHLDVPMGLRTFGYDENDVPALVEGTLPQHRVTKISPRPVGREELTLLFHAALDG